VAVAVDVIAINSKTFGSGLPQGTGLPDAPGLGLGPPGVELPRGSGTPT